MDCNRSDFRLRDFVVVLVRFDWCARNVSLIKDRIVLVRGFLPAPINVCFLQGFILHGGGDFPFLGHGQLGPYLRSPVLFFRFKIRGVGNFSSIRGRDRFLLFRGRVIVCFHFSIDSCRIEGGDFCFSCARQRFNRVNCFLRVSIRLNHSFLGLCASGNHRLRRCCLLGLCQVVRVHVVF